MKLTANNISFVKRHECGGITYGWFVSMKSGAVSDARTFINYDERGRTCVKPYEKERLPKAVQKFIASHDERILYEKDGDDFKHYIIA